MSFKKIAIYLFVFFLFFLSSFSCVWADEEDIVKDAAGFSALPWGNADTTDGFCDKINTYMGRTYCTCNMQLLDHANPAVNITRKYCGKGTVKIHFQPALAQLAHLTLTIDTTQGICNTSHDQNNALIQFKGSCEIDQYQAPDACLCYQDRNKTGIGNPRPSQYLLVNSGLNVLAKDVKVDPLTSMVVSGIGIDASSPESKVSEPTLLKILGYANFKAGKTCVPYDPALPLEDRIWDCSVPVYINKSTLDVCCCEGAKCVKKNVFTAGVQVCGVSEKQVPVPPSGDCNINIGTVGKISGMDLDVLKQRAATELNPLKFTDPTNIIGRILKVVPMYMGAIAMMMYIWAGVLWMTASGNAERTTKAKVILVWTTLGVVAILASYMLVSFIFNTVLKISV